MFEVRTIPKRVRQSVDGRSARKEDVGELRPRRVIPCEACDTNAGPILEYHHIMPFEAGGRHVPGNLVKLCPTCHSVITRDRGLWAKKSGMYSSEVADRLDLLADIQHEPAAIVWRDKPSRIPALRWLHELTGFERDDLPDNASWGRRWKQELRTEKLAADYEAGKIRI